MLLRWVWGFSVYWQRRTIIQSESHPEVKTETCFFKPWFELILYSLLAIIYLFFNGNLKAAIRDDFQARLSDTRWDSSGAKWFPEGSLSLPEGRRPPVWALPGQKDLDALYQEHSSQRCETSQTPEEVGLLMCSEKGSREATEGRRKKRQGRRHFEVDSVDWGSVSWLLRSSVVVCQEGQQCGQCACLCVRTLTDWSGILCVADP